MMKLHLERIKGTADATFGNLWLDGKLFCFTLEDEYRFEKLHSETRIPAGTYKIDLRNEGGLTKKYARRFPDFHRGMLWLRDVPGFNWIYLHVGNTDDDTAGCVLVGMAGNLTSMEIQSSTPAYRALYEAVVDAAEAGELEITVEDRDR